MERLCGWNRLIDRAIMHYRLTSVTCKRDLSWITQGVKNKVTDMALPLSLVPVSRCEQCINTRSTVNCGQLLVRHGSQRKSYFMKTISRIIINSNSKIESLKTIRHLHRQLAEVYRILPNTRRPAETISTHHPANEISWFRNGDSNWSTERRSDGEENREQNENDGPEKPRFNQFLLSITLILTTLWVLQFLTDSTSNDEALSNRISWNEFLHDLLAKGEVKEVVIRPEMEMAAIHLHPGAVIKGHKSHRLWFTMAIPDPYKFEEKLRQAENSLGIDSNNQVVVTYRRQSNWTRVVFLAVILFLAFLLVKSAAPKVNITDMFAQERKAKFVRVDGMSRSGNAVKFKDVAGLKEAKIEIMEFVDYLKNPQRFKDIGAKIPRGALLLGPPGCGKTLLARAVAYEAQVPFLAMAGSEFVEMLGGLGASRVRDLFKEAKKQAPCIIYIDEIDAIGKKRGSGKFDSNAEEDHTLNQLLVEMDGIGTQQDVIMLGATNRVDMLDKALMRPGRFDRHIMIDLPTLIERRETFQLYLKNLKFKDDPAAFTPWLAQLTPGMSGADINNLCNEAAIHAAREAKEFIDKQDLEYALERIVAGAEKKSRLLSPEEKKVVAFHECGHALVGWLLPTTDALLRVSIVPRTSNALGFAQYKPTDQKLYSEQELFERMCMALGGRVAEAVMFNQVTTGAADDLVRVTKLAYDQIRAYGMNERVGCVSFAMGEGSEFMVKPYSKGLSAIIDQESQALVARAYRHAEHVISTNQDSLKKLASSLIERETLTYDDVVALIGPPPHGEKDRVEVQDWEAAVHDENNNNNNNTSGDDDGGDER